MASMKSLGVLAAILCFSSASAALACSEGQTYCSNGTRYTCYCKPPGSTFCSYQPVGACHRNDPDPRAERASIAPFKKYASAGKLTCQSTASLRF
jgi:hypothetical protein